MGRGRHVAWVTGGGRGIGRACAQALARDGLDVGLSARTEAELVETSKQVEKHKVRAAHATADFNDPAAVRRAYAAVAKALGPPDVLVNAAGVARSAPFLKTTPDFLDMHWRLNLVGTFHAMQAALPAMVEKGWGRIVNIASIAGKVGAPYIAAYTASKHAVVGLTRAVAAEFAAKGVTVNAVCPGYVETKMTEDNLAIIVEKTGMSRAQALETIKNYSPQRRLISPAEVAEAVAYLVREDARGVNGQALTIDGGAVQW